MPQPTTKGASTLSCNASKWIRFSPVVSVLVAIFTSWLPLQAANQSGECYVTVNVTEGTLPSGWSYQLQYFDTDSNWYNGTSGNSTQTYYKQQPDWINKSIQWRCQIQLNGSNYGTPQTNTCFAGSDSVAFTVTAPQIATAPSIISHPLSQTVPEGGSATFSVTASGTAPLNFQWRKNGADIPGATSTVIILSSVTAADAAGYSCRVSNAAGNATSNVATLTLTSELPESSGAFPSASDWVQQVTFEDFPLPENIPGTMQSSDGVFVTTSHYSADGITWSPIQYPSYNYWINSVSHGNGTFVLTGAVGQIFTSNDFVNWTTRNPGGEDITQVVYGNNTFVARKFWSTGDMWVSKDNGASWTTVGCANFFL